MIEKLLEYVKKEGLDDVFFYNTNGYDVGHISLMKYRNGKCSAFVNGERGYEAMIMNVSEKEACDFCYKYLEYEKIYREQIGGSKQK